MGLDQAAQLQDGNQYTFSFQLSAYGVPVSQADIAGALNQLSECQSVSIKESTAGSMGATLAGGAWDITFTYSEYDVPEDVSTVAQRIQAVVEATHYLVTFSFIQAVQGSNGVNAGDTSPMTYAIMALVALGLILAIKIT